MTVFAQWQRLAQTEGFGGSGADLLTFIGIFCSMFKPLKGGEEERSEIPDELCSAPHKPALPSAY